MRLPAGAEAIAVLQAPGDAELTMFGPAYALAPAPPAHGLVALKGPVVARFLMALKVREGRFSMERSEGFAGVATQEPEGAAPGAKGAIQLGEARGDEVSVLAVEVALGPKRGFKNIKRQHGAALGGSPERFVIIEA